MMALITLFTIVATKAFFNASAESLDNIFVSGTLDLSVDQDSILSINNWKPGEEHTMNFQIKNIGTLPVHIKGYLAGNWSNQDLDSSLFELSALKVLVNGVWQEFNTSSLGLNSEFFISNTFTDENLISIQPNEDIEVQITVKLAENVGDEYQNQTFNSSLHIAGKQVAENVSWPTTY
jgi:hypothetical protein